VRGTFEATIRGKGSWSPRGILTAAQVSQRVLGALPSSAHARGYLLDHAFELRELLAELSGVEVIDVTESVLQRAGGAWAQR